MRLELNLTEEQKSEVVSALMQGMLDSGVALAAPERTRPYSVAEAAEALGVSDSTVMREVEAGILKRLPNTGRILIPVRVIRARQDGEVMSCE